ncbi:hypothetical protein DY000_02010213 [Brassica cretica]|uniref:Uncharacterized protein n=1 Tax=Brassica cretica TaxID=69181 RepID=A0ABQ7BTF3_BRACR|nr:hypothetical protein DY000_02010213 [Brassica cretica]
MRLQEKRGKSVFAGRVTAIQEVKDHLMNLDIDSTPVVASLVVDSKDLVESLVDFDSLDDETHGAAEDIQERAMTDSIARSRIGTILEFFSIDELQSKMLKKDDLQSFGCCVFSGLRCPQRDGAWFALETAQVYIFDVVTELTQTAVEANDFVVWKDNSQQLQIVRGLSWKELLAGYMEHVRSIHDTHCFSHWGEAIHDRSSHGMQLWGFKTWKYKYKKKMDLEVKTFGSRLIHKVKQTRVAPFEKEAHQEMVAMMHRQDSEDSQILITGLQKPGMVNTQIVQQSQESKALWSHVSVLVKKKKLPETILGKIVICHRWRNQKQPWFLYTLRSWLNTFRDNIKAFGRADADTKSGYSAKVMCENTGIESKLITLVDSWKPRRWFPTVGFLCFMEEKFQTKKTVWFWIKHVG